MLDEFQKRLVIAAQGASSTVRLVGGTGLALVLGHRVSDDVDLFCAPREDIEPVVRAVETTATSDGAQVVSVRTAPRYRRLEIVRAGAPTLRLDIAADSSQRLEPEPLRIGALWVETLRDQRANKLITLLGRSELRDLVDLYFIERAGLPAADGLHDALAKDGGMDPGWFAWALEQVKIHALPGMLAPLAEDELRRFRDRLQRDVLRLASGSS